MTVNYHDDSGNAVVHGMVIVTMNQATRVMVEISAQAPWGSTVVSPYTILFTDNGEKDFEVSLQIPPGEDYNSEGTVTIFGKWTMYPGTLSGSCEPVTARISVGLYSDFSLSSGESLMKAAPGAEVKFELTITNYGNSADIFICQVKNENELYDNGFFVGLSSSSVDIPRGFRDTINISVKTPSKKFVYSTHDIVIEVNSGAGIQQNIPAKEHIFQVQLKNKDNPRTINLYVLLMIAIIVIIICIILFWTWRKRRK